MIKIIVCVCGCVGVWVCVCVGVGVLVCGRGCVIKFNILFHVCDKIACLCKNWRKNIFSLSKAFELVGKEVNHTEPFTSIRIPVCINANVYLCLCKCVCVCVLSFLIWKRSSLFQDHLMKYLSELIWLYCCFAAALDNEWRIKTTDI